MNTGIHKEFLLRCPPVSVWIFRSHATVHSFPRKGESDGSNSPSLLVLTSKKKAPKKLEVRGRHHKATTVIY